MSTAFTKKIFAINFLACFVEFSQILKQIAHHHHKGYYDFLKQKI